MASEQASREKKQTLSPNDNVHQNHAKSESFIKLNSALVGKSRSFVVITVVAIGVADLAAAAAAAGWGGGGGGGGGEGGGGRGGGGCDAGGAGGAGYVGEDVDGQVRTAMVVVTNGGGEGARAAAVSVAVAVAAHARGGCGPSCCFGTVQSECQRCASGVDPLTIHATVQLLGPRSLRMTPVR